MSDRSRLSRIGDSLSFSSSPQESSKSPSGRPPAGKKRQRRRFRLYLAGGGFLVLAGLLGGLLVLLGLPHPAYLVPVAAGATDDLAMPANAYGLNAVDAAVELDERGDVHSWSFWPRKLKVRHDTPRLTSLDAWKKLIQGDFGKEKTVIFYLDAPGGTDENGNPYVLAQDRSRIRIKEDVFDGFRDAPHLKNKHKLLLIDATKLQADWPRTIHNDFARGLAGLNAKVNEVGNLVVISASDIDEHSWVSEDAQKTIFAKLALEALSGQTGDERGKKLKALDLYNYVRGGVSKWAAAMRHARQTPVLLPEGKAGEELARKMDVTTSTGKAGSPPPSPPSLDSLIANWNEYEALRKGSPPPAAYSPHLWAAYRRMLLRCDELALAGRSNDANAMKTKLTELADKIKAARELSLTSQDSSLALRQAFGPDEDKPDADRKRLFEELWSTEKREAARKPPDRLQFTRWVIDEKLPESGQPFRERLTQARDSLRAVFQMTNDRPVEALYVAFLERDLPKPAPPEALLRQAVMLRRKAEQVALGVGPGGPALGPAYSERVYPWVRAEVELGDQHRRLGEDRLFAGDAKSWDQTAKEFTEADAHYQRAAKDGASVRRALWACDRAYSDLPYYSRWLARTADDGHTDLYERVKALWDNVHTLAQLVQEPNPKFLATPANSNPQADRITTELDDLEKRFQEECDRLGNLPNSVESRQKIEDALRVPSVAPRVRMELLSQLLRVARVVQDESKGGELTVPAPDQAATSNMARKAAWRQGQMAVAVLGPNGRTEHVKQLLERVQPGHDESWETPARQASADLAAEWQRNANELTDSAAQAAKLEDVAAARTALAVAAQRCRQVDGALVAVDAGNPVADQRRLRLNDLLLWEAQRTFCDFWWSEEKESDTPYYMAAGLKYITDGQNVLEKVRGPLADVCRTAARDLGDRIKARKDLQIVWYDRVSTTLKAVPKQVAITGELKIDLPYRLKADLPDFDGKPSAGVPVAWAELPERDRTRFGAAGPGFAQRRGLELEKSTPGEAMTMQPLINPSPIRLLTRLDTKAREEESAPIKTEVTAHALFRGHLLDSPTTLVVKPTADSIVYRHPVPDAAAIAVIPDPNLKRPRGMMAIVVDYSESMKKQTRFKGGTRKDAAIAALKAVLSDKGLEGTVVSVFVFGQKENLYSPGVEFSSREDMTQRLLSPQPWHTDQVDDLVKRASALTPRYGTPLIRAIWTAKKVFEEERASYPDHYRAGKTLVVLTDGDDSDFSEDKKLQQVHRTDSIPAFLKAEFGESDVALNVVLFEGEPDERQRAMAQFRDIDTFKTRGEIYKDEIQSTAELAAKLRDALGLTYRVLQDGKRVLPWQEQGLNLVRTAELEIAPTPTWYSLDPGRYMLFDKSPSKGELPQINFKAGEPLLLMRTANGYQPARMSDLPRFKDHPPPARMDARKNWLLTVLQDEQKLAHQQVLLATLEKPSGAGAAVSVFQQVWPQEVWFEIKRTGDPAPSNGFRCGNLVASPAPTWDLRLPEKLPNADLTVWISDDVPFTTWWPEGSRPPQLSASRAVTRTVVVGGKPTEVTVSIERLTVVDRQGKEIPEYPCLVVRSSYNVGHPIFARHRDMKLEMNGFEHHYYTTESSGNYTGVFWFGRLNNDDDVAKLASEITLVAVNDLKKSAADADTVISLKPDIAGKPDEIRPHELDLLRFLREAAEKNGKK
jgi:hypothetical protein